MFTVIWIVKCISSKC